MNISDDIWTKFRKEEIDINNQQLFLSILLKGLLYDLNRRLSIRDVNIPHFILNTGDDILYLESKGYDLSKEPGENTNEDYVYSVIPRCLVQPEGINILSDQLTSPYIRGKFEVEYNDNIYSFIAEFRRMPLKINVTLKYVLDTFTDVLQLSQQIMSRMAFINDFSVIYLGNHIPGSYIIPTDMSPEMSMEFDGLSTDSKTKNLSLDLEVETCIPIINSKTLIPSDRFIKNMYQTHMISETEKHSHPRGLKEKLEHKDEVK